jgi:hypothetical protein
MSRQLPYPFRPKLLSDFAVAGICLIRLERVRPFGMKWPMGVSSENAAHRVAVCWRDLSGRDAEGVFIPRRDSNSILNRVGGGRLFPGEHHAARFQVCDDRERIDLAMISTDGDVRVEIKAHTGKTLPATSRFASLEEASRFFEGGSLGYSSTTTRGRLDGLYLQTKVWKVAPLDVDFVYSSFFADEDHFPKGSVEFDSALLMRDIPHEWHSAPDLQVP